MKEFSDPSELLTEPSLISLDEKKEIISQIDNDFFSHFEDSRDFKEIAKNSKGIVLPFTVGVLFIVITIITISCINKRLVPGISMNSVNANVVSSSSEWGVLKLYMEESAKKLQTKDKEIEYFKDLIVTYDEKLTTLRKLLNIKTETEKKLEEERSKLVTIGIPEETISLKMDDLEQELISDLTPGMIEFYDLNIDELNRQIDQILNDKTVVEENLKLSIEERKFIAVENEKITLEVQTKTQEISQVSEAMDAMKVLTNISERYEEEKETRYQIYDIYKNVFQNVNEKNYEGALDGLEVLRQFIQNNQNGEGGLETEQLLIHLDIIAGLKDYITGETKPTIPVSQPIQKSGTDIILEQISELTEKILTDPDRNTSKEAESELRAEIYSIPEIEKALSILEKGNDDSKADTTKESVSQELTSSEKLVLIGSISSINFDRITINPTPDITVKPETLFYIFKMDDPVTERILGTGVILEQSGISLMGKLESLYVSSIKPEKDDLIYIEQ